MEIIHEKTGMIRSMSETSWNLIKDTSHGKYMRPISEEMPMPKIIAEKFTKETLSNEEIKELPGTNWDTDFDNTIKMYRDFFLEKGYKIHHLEGKTKLMERYANHIKKHGVDSTN